VGLALLIMLAMSVMQRACSPYLLSRLYATMSLMDAIAFVVGPFVLSTDVITAQIEHFRETPDAMLFNMFTVGVVHASMARSLQWHLDVFALHISLRTLGFVMTARFAGGDAMFVLMELLLARNIAPFLASWFITRALVVWIPQKMSSLLPASVPPS